MPRLKRQHPHDVLDGVGVAPEHVEQRRPLVPPLGKVGRDGHQPVEVAQRDAILADVHGGDAGCQEPVGGGVAGLHPDAPDAPGERPGHVRRVRGPQLLEQRHQPRVLLVGRHRPSRGEHGQGGKKRDQGGPAPAHRRHYDPTGPGAKRKTRRRAGPRRHRSRTVERPAGCGQPCGAPLDAGWLRQVGLREGGGPGRHCVAHAHPRAVGGQRDQVGRGEIQRQRDMLGDLHGTRRGHRIANYLRSDTTFFPGFSGGPLVDAAGRVIGVNSSRLGRGAGLTIPLAAAAPIINDLLE
ncbi:MAG: serine protease, partial [Alphaproteobacteria bacterium]|nr:serine protease [Alphaproteobacteria bacterium]